jgi:hypothetical protein
MSFLKKLFGKVQRENTVPLKEDVKWIEATDNNWHVRVLDLRPITLAMLSTSTNPQMAQNAVSYGGDDGTSFWGKEPAEKKATKTNLTIPTDKKLQAGALFIPNTMEHKWAIYFDGDTLLFVRSWLRQVFVTAKTSQQNNQLIIESIEGEFTPNESPDFTKAVLNFLLISHAIGEAVPAPLPKDLESNPKEAALWAFSTYGNQAQFGIFDTRFVPSTNRQLRSHSLLHIAVARGNSNEIEKLVQEGFDINSLAADGLGTLHWSTADDSGEAMKKLLELDANPNLPSSQGATPIMNAVQSNKIDHFNLLLQSGALVNARDNRGFTALHRAAEMGHTKFVEILLRNGADKTIVAENHTALSLAVARGHQQIIDLLS